MRFVLGMGLVCLLAPAPLAAQAPEALPDVGNADKVVVAVVEDVVPRYAVNEFGDRLIVSEVWLRVEETLKGAPENLVPIEVEGGTVGDVTMRVSDLPMLRKGERGLFLLDANRNGKRRPHGRGEGILKIDRSDRVIGSNLRVADVRASVKRSQQK